MTAVESQLFDPTLVEDASDAVAFITSVLESSTEYSIIGTSVDGTIVLWNEGARRNYGYDSDEVIGKLNSDALHTPEDSAAGTPARLLAEAPESGATGPEPWSGSERTENASRPAWSSPPARPRRETPSATC